MYSVIIGAYIFRPYRVASPNQKNLYKYTQIIYEMKGLFRMEHIMNQG